MTNVHGSGYCLGCNKVHAVGIGTQIFQTGWKIIGDIRYPLIKCN